MRNFGVFSLLLVCLISAISSTDAAKNNSIQWGSIGPGDVLLYRKIVVVHRKLFQKVKEDVEYLGNGRSIITSIKAIDQYQDGNGGYATLLTPGIGQTSVKIHLKSQRSHGLNFIIEIYGR